MLERLHVTLWHTTPGNTAITLSYEGSETNCKTVIIKCKPYTQLLPQRSSLLFIIPASYIMPVESSYTFEMWDIWTYGCNDENNCAMCMCTHIVWQNCNQTQDIGYFSEVVQWL